MPRNSICPGDRDGRGPETTRPRDIFIVCNSIEELGGLVRWAHDIGRLFAARGHRVHLIGITHPAYRLDFGTDLPYQMTVLNETRPPGTWRPRGLRGRLDVGAMVRELRRRRMYASSTAELSGIFRAARPGGVVIAAQIWAMEWVAGADTTGLKVVGMSHESYRATRESSRYARVRRYYSDVDSLLVLTDRDADLWAMDGMSQVGVMPNPLTIKPSRYPALTEPVVVSLGRLSHEKGVDLLLEAWNIVAPQFPDWRLRVYGSGPEEESLRAQAAELGIGGTVEFCGQTSDVSGALAGGALLALPSRAEGFPITLLEAMGHGLPSVAFDCAPGVSELLSDEGTGLLVSPGNVVGFAAGLERLMKDQDLRRRLGGAARESVRRYDPDVIVDRWERLFALLYR